MGLFDKIKDALFEEEYVEVEEPVVKSRKKDSIKKDNSFNKPIAKKVVLPKHENKVIDLEEEKPIIEEEQEEKHEEVVHNRFPMMDDNDFKVDDNYKSYEKPRIVDYEEKELRVDKDIYNVPPKKEVKEEKHELYGIKSDTKINIEPGAYEKKENRTYFKPSPIISPIYGVLDKNYRKEEIVNKREVRLSSSYSRENLNVDDVRKKAYGSLADEIALGVDDKKPKKVVKEENTEIDLLVDLSNDDKPKLNDITVGDAEEYFQDLGLEYNIDYKDTSRVNSNAINDIESDSDVGKHVKINDSNVIDINDNSEVIKSNNQNNIIDQDDDSDDNLFDLIDSMYDKE